MVLHAGEMFMWLIFLVSATIISDRNIFILITSPPGELQFFLHSSHISDGRLPLTRVSTRSIGGGGSGGSGGSRLQLSYCTTYPACALNCALKQVASGERERV